MRNIADNCLQTHINKFKQPNPIRPKSQQPRISFQDSSPCSKLYNLPSEDISRKSFQASPTVNEYYTQSSQKSMREVTSPRKVSMAEGCERERWQKWKRIINEKIERCVGELREQIYRQSAQIMQLQRKLQEQDRLLDNKNSIIASLIGKLQQRLPSKTRDFTCANESMIVKKVNDLQSKLRLLTGQFEDEQSAINNKIEHLTEDTIRAFGAKIRHSKHLLLTFVSVRDKELTQMESQLQKMSQSSQIQYFLRPPQTTKADMKNSSGGSVRQTCSSVNSKSTISDKPPVNKRRDQSTFSDYFFHPVEPESSCLKSVEELIKDREQLPIRVFADPLGRLKYWETRTYMFDRRGNFTAPTAGDLVLMEDRGWLKMVSE